MSKTLDSHFIEFIMAYDNYHLKEPDLLNCVVSLFADTKNMEYDDAKEKYDIFCSIIVENELHGTEDLVDPINNLYYEYIKPELT